MLSPHSLPPTLTLCLDLLSQPSPYITWFDLVLIGWQDGAPYILSLEAGPAEHDARSQGYTFVTKTVFKNKEDFDYYDTQCEAHKELKTKAKSLDIQGVMMVYFTPTFVAGASL